MFIAGKIMGMIGILVGSFWMMIFIGIPLSYDFELINWVFCLPIAALGGFVIWISSQLFLLDE